jgi:hypothetical protein
MTMPIHIVRDIGNKCSDDVAAAISRNMHLVDTPKDASSVAFFGAASALGAASGAFLATQPMNGGGMPADVLAAALWSILQPMVVGSIERIQERKA